MIRVSMTERLGDHSIDAHRRDGNVGSRPHANNHAVPTREQGHAKSLRRSFDTGQCSLDQPSGVRRSRTRPQRVSFNLNRRLRERNI